MGNARPGPPPARGPWPQSLPPGNSHGQGVPAQPGGQGCSPPLWAGKGRTGPAGRGLPGRWGGDPGTLRGASLVTGDTSIALGGSGQGQPGGGAGGGPVLLRHFPRPHCPQGGCCRRHFHEFKPGWAARGGGCPWAGGSPGCLPPAPPKFSPGQLPAPSPRRAAATGHAALGGGGAPTGRRCPEQVGGHRLPQPGTSGWPCCRPQVTLPGQGQLPVLLRCNPQPDPPLPPQGRLCL